MKNKLIEDINNYISFLNQQGLSISVHGKMVSGLLEHNIHKNPYCTYVKTNDEARKKCVGCQQNVFNKYQDKYLFGMCYAGVEEYVFFVDAKTFISVSGYGMNKEKATERITRLSQDYCFNRSELLNIYEHGLIHETANIEQLKIQIKPLCHMLSLLQFMIGDISETTTKNKTLDSIIAYIQRNIMQDITLRSIAQACACSESTVSHLFKEYTNQSVKKYIMNLRMKQAEKLLLTSDLPITNIALLCGFSNSNYFSTAFRKTHDMSPAEYRKENNQFIPLTEMHLIQKH